tara:strand:+ start:121 stop:1455 length:1335 start_codon:yes stop_codon:yes gene_type:complete
MSKFNITNNVISIDISNEVDELLTKLNSIVIETAYQRSDPSQSLSFSLFIEENTFTNPDTLASTSGGVSLVQNGPPGPDHWFTGGTFTLNQDRLNEMKNEIRDGGKNTLFYVMLHETLHLMGLQYSMWTSWGYVKSYTETSTNSTKYYYDGPNALNEYKAQFNNNNFIGIPLEEDGQTGTVIQHFEEGLFENISLDNRLIPVTIDGNVVELFHPGLTSEITTGFINSFPNFLPLNLTTFGALEDIGYYVDYTKADNYYEPTKDIVCFLENTKILCLENNIEKNVLVQDLVPGTLVKTYSHGYIPLDIIGNKTIVNPNSQIKDYLGNRLKNQLYVLNTNNNDPLILTGCHSLLVDKLTESQKRNMLLECNGKTYMTDEKYRLMAYLSDMKIYDYSGSANIWHFSLERQEENMNYGVYANGILVESCSKRMMLSYSDMKLKHYSDI